MKKNKILICLFFYIPFLCMALWCGSLIYATKHADQVMIAVKGFDPRDILSGNYINYKIEWKKTNCAQFKNGICPQKDFQSISHRFYLPAEAAQKIGQLMQGKHSESIRFDIIFSYIKGRTPIARMLLINNQKWFDYLNKNERK